VKIIAVILSFYVLGLNFLACNDDFSSLKTDTEITEVDFQDLDIDHTHDQQADSCSPFCSCHCCHVHTINFNSPEFQPLVSNISSEIFTNFDGLSKEIPHSLLQPPQV
jgi:hypothetical protein